MRTPPRRLAAAVSALAALIPAAAHAQSNFAAKVGDTFRVVRDITGGDTPVVDMGTELKPVIAREYTMLNFPFFRKGFIALKDIRATTHTLTVGGSGNFNNELQIEGLATSDTALGQCFIVMELFEEGGTSVLFTKVPDFPKDREVRMDIRFALNGPPEEGHYILHFYSAGFEVLNSRLSPTYVTAQKAKTDAIAGGAVDYRPILRRSVAPVRPPRVSASVSGRVQLDVRISAAGAVVSATARQPSDSDFIDAAVTAVKQWKFDPAIKDRKFVESNIVIPVTFPLVPLPKK